MKKRIFTAVVAFCVLLCGCGVINDNKEPGRTIPITELTMENTGYTGSVEKVALYFLNETSDTLTAEIRNIIIEQNTNPAEVAIKELLEGPSSDQLHTGVAPAGMSLEHIEYSRGVANVYLLYNGDPLLQQQKYILELAIANTVTDIMGANYISIFYNGIQTGFSGVPYAPLKKQTGSVEDAWFQASGKYLEVPPVPGMEEPEDTATPAVSPEPEETTETETTPAPKINKINTVLYFISTDGGFILPEVREVKYTDANYIATLIEELEKGPQNTSVMKRPLVDDLELVTEPVLTPVEGSEGYSLSLDFSVTPARYDLSDRKELLASYAALIYTLTGFLPKVENVEFYVDGKIIDAAGTSGGVMKRRDFLGYIGGSVPLYFSDENSDLLLEVQRSMEQGKTWSAKERVLELLKGPLTEEGENAGTVIITGMTEQDILSVDIYSDTAYVDLSQNFKDVCKGISSKTEMLLVYSIVNTITAMDGINKVQFLVEGQQIDTLAGNLCLSNPFLRNYGIIKQ